MTVSDPSVGLADRAPARPAGPRPAKAPSTRAARDRRKWFEIAGLTAPAAIVYAMFVLAPMGFAVYYSLFRWRGNGPPTELRDPLWQNYINVFQEPDFIAALRNNAIIVVGSLLVQLPLALGIALLLNRRFRGRAVFRLLAFVPYVLAEITVGIMWRLVLVNDGALDSFMRAVGLGGLVQSWLADLDVVIWTLLGILTWKYVGFAIILFLAGLSNVPDELSEAAAIDGASWWQVQRHVTIPLLGPTIRIWMFLSIIGSLQVFDVVYAVAAPAVRSLGAGSTMATFMVDSGFFPKLWGFGNAIAVIMFVISFAAALLFQRLFLRRDLEGALTGK